MKDQYFCDLNDYRKYGLLRALADAGSLKIGVCWMRTAPDGRPDGSRTAYLGQPDKFRACDPELFDKLQGIVKGRKARRLGEAERGGLVPAARYYAEPLTDSGVAREAWWKGMLHQFRKTDLIFFDPDNGLEVKSKPWGCKGSSKYLYWHEAQVAFWQGHSLLLYQHFPRVQRRRYTAQRVRTAKAKLGAVRVAAFVTSSVLFLLIIQLRHACALHQRAATVPRAWGGQIEVQ